MHYTPRRTRPFTFRSADLEYELLLEWARVRGTSMAGLVRDAALAAARRDLQLSDGFLPPVPAPQR